MSNLAIDTDHPMDKAVFLFEGQINVTTADDAIFRINHNIGAMLFVDGIWSPDNWATTFSFGSSRRTGDVIGITSSLLANDTRIEGSIRYNANVTVKYRIWGFVNEAETLALDVAGTSALSQNIFVINSDYNYPRLVMEGYANKGDTINHNLGEIPRVDIWRYDSYIQGYGKLYNDGFGLTYGGFGEFAKITANQIEFSNVTGAGDKYYYRVYES